MVNQEVKISTIISISDCYYDSEDELPLLHTHELFL